jgi:quinolinate synthase
MKFVTPEKVLQVLEQEKNQVMVSEKMRARALLPLNRMLELAR